MEVENPPALTCVTRYLAAYFHHTRAHAHARSAVFMRLFEQFALVLLDFGVGVGEKEQVLGYFTLGKRLIALNGGDLGSRAWTGRRRPTRFDVEGRADYWFTQGG